MTCSTSTCCIVSRFLGKPHTMQGDPNHRRDPGRKVNRAHIFCYDTYNYNYSYRTWESIYCTQIQSWMHIHPYTSKLFEVGTNLEYDYVLKQPSFTLCWIISQPWWCQLKQRVLHAGTIQQEFLGSIQVLRCKCWHTPSRAWHMPTDKTLHSTTQTNLALLRGKTNMTWWP